jgi:superfamily II DNA or RNA helicase
MIISVNTLNSKINTDNQKLLASLYKLYSESTPGYQYFAAYKRGHWDGKTHFITKSGKFKTGLLPRILEDLKKIECYPEIVYESEDCTSELKDWEIEGFSYYDYQRDLIKIGLDRKRGVIKSPTGSGKTLIMAGLVKALHGKKMVLLFNAKQLLTQSYEFLTEVCGIEDVGLCYGEGYIYGDIMLCTVQSIEKILDTHMEEAEVLMVDECHEFSNGKTTLAAIGSFPKAQYRLGFTATPPSDIIPKYNLEGTLGPIYSSVNTSELVKEGKLAKPIIQLLDLPYSASGVDEDMSYLEIYETYIVNNEKRNNLIKDIVNEIKRTNKRARILILTKSLDHGRALENLLGSGEVQFLEGADSISERYKSISRFRRTKGSSTLIGTKILQTGINIEEITHFINARGMKSEIATLQALGRALRKHDSKPRVYVYDFLDKEKYLKAHAKARRKHYKNEGHEIIIL